MKIALLGDIALIGKYDLTLSEPEDVHGRIEAIRDTISDCDVVIANLESPLTETTHTWMCKGVYLRSDSVNVRTLKYLGVTYVTIANNHVFDYGVKGMEDTIRCLENENIKYVGINHGECVIEDGNSRIALDGFCCLSANGLRYGNRAGYIQLLAYDAVKAFLERAKSRKALPIVSAHFGVERVHYPAPEHMKLFRKLADQYTFILHGHHPHVMQGYEHSGKSLFLYSLGNMIFDDCLITSMHCPVKWNNEELNSYIMKIDIENNTIISNEIIPFSSKENGYYHINDSSYDHINEYSTHLSDDYHIIQQYRNANVYISQKRNIRFYIDRLNWKYIGAFVNGKIHAYEYQKVMNDFLR